MKFIPTGLKGSFVIEATPVKDTRGWFFRTYCKREFAGIGHSKEWVQMNHSHTEQKGTLRGMHYQKPPHGEIKLVRCVRGAVYDVIVDLRRNSPTFLHHFGSELSEQNQRSLYIPEGFAHGFQTLQNQAELVYLHTQFYTPEAEGGLRYDDPELKIAWPLPVQYLSDRDATHPILSKNFLGL